MNQDINDGFASYYAYFVFLQQHIKQPWINNLCLKYYSIDSLVNFDKASISIIEGVENELIIPREKY